MRVIGNDQKSNRQNFWEILERIIGKILSIIGASLLINEVPWWAVATANPDQSYSYLSLSTLIKLTMLTLTLIPSLLTNLEVN